MQTNGMQQDLEEYIKGLLNGLDCYIIFSSDNHINEYVREEDQRIKKLSGFTGSYGVVVYSNEPCLITDSRYYIIAEKESKFPLYKKTLQEYLTEKKYKRISFDTRTISAKYFKKLKEFFDKNSIEVVITNFTLENKRKLSKESLIDLETFCLKDFIDYDNIKLKKYLRNKVRCDAEEYDHCILQNVTGSSYLDKIKKLRSVIGEANLIVTELDTIAWILNLRGSDIQYNPMFFAYMIVNSNETIVFTDHKVNRPKVIIKPYNSFEEYLSTILNSKSNQQIVISSDCNQYIYELLSCKNSVSFIEDVRVLQSSKNKIELLGMSLAYFYDGVALCELFSYVNKNNHITEENVSEKLNEIKQYIKGYVGPSFETISCTGPNSASPHHKASHDIIDKAKVYLIDSGSQYIFGTTDTTRTLYFGNDTKVTAEERSMLEKLRHDYTLVLKGHLEAMIRIYSNKEGYQLLDFNSRKYLMKEGKNFGHATGHGVGHFLCVHEHPPVIHSMMTDSPINRNQVFSIEPGFYLENEYGIRIENLVFSTECSDNNENTVLTNITLVPYQNNILDPQMLSPEHINYYNDANKVCIEVLWDSISPAAQQFLIDNSYQI